MESARQWTFESLEAMRGDARPPSPLFLQVVQEMSEKIGLDAATIIGGAAIEFKGINFWLAHHGNQDPDGLVLMIHMGTIAADFESVILRRLLEHNATTPAGACGYYSLLPDTDTVALCLRLDMARAHNPSDAVLAYVGLFAKQLEDFTQLMCTGLETARQQADAQSQPGQPAAR